MATTKSLKTKLPRCIHTKSWSCTRPGISHYHDNNKIYLRPNYQGAYKPRVDLVHVLVSSITMTTTKSTKTKLPRCIHTKSWSSTRSGISHYHDNKIYLRPNYQGAYIPRVDLVHVLVSPITMTTTKSLKPNYQGVYIPRVDLVHVLVSPFTMTTTKSTKTKLPRCIHTKSWYCTCPGISHYHDNNKSY